MAVKNSISKKYFRIHIKENAYHTGQPKGLFVAVWNLVDQEILNDEEISLYWENRKWFEKYLPIPPFYDDGNSIKAITWYKNTHAGQEMFRKMDYYLEIAKKYNMPLFLSQTNSIPGTRVYEDEYQIGVSNQVSPSEVTTQPLI